MIPTMLRARLRLTTQVIVLLAASLFSTHAFALSLMDGMKNSLVNFLLEKISVPGQFEVAAAGIDSPGDGQTVLHGLTVSDTNGIWFKAEQLSLAWSPARLLKGEVQIDAITLDRGRLDRLPDTPQAPSPDSDAPSTSGWPRSPITLHIAKIALSDFRISDAVAPQAIAFDADGALRDEGNEQSLQLDLQRRDAIRGQINVRYLKRFDDDGLKLRLEAREAASGLVAQVVGLPKDVPANLLIDGDGTPSQWRGRLDMDVADWLRCEGSVEAAWRQRLNLAFGLNVAPGHKLAQAPRLAIGEQANVRIKLHEDDAGSVRIEHATLNANALKATGRGYFQRDGSNLDVMLDLEVDDAASQRLAPLTQPLTFTSGKLSLHASGAVSAPRVSANGDLLAPVAGDFAAERATLELDARSGDGETSRARLVAINPRGPTSSYAKVLGNEVRIDFEGQRMGQRFNVDRLLVSADALTLNTNGSIDLEPKLILDLDYTVRASQLRVLAALAEIDAHGALHARGHVTGTVDNLQTAGQIDLTQAVVNQQALGRVSLEHDTRVAEAIDGRVRLTMRSQTFGNGNAATQFRIHDNVKSLRSLKLDLLGVTASGDLQFARGANLPSGRLRFSVTSLQPIGRLTGRNLAGTGEGDLALDARAHGEATLRAVLSNLQLDDLSVADISLDGVAHRLRAKDAHLNAQVNLSALRTPQATVDTLAMTAQGPLAGLSIRGELRGQHGAHPFDAASRILAVLNAPTKTIDVEQLAGHYAGEAIGLSNPARVEFDDRTVRVQALNVRLPDAGQINADVAISDRAARAKLKFARVPLRLARLVSDVAVESGWLDGTVDANTDASTPVLDAKLSLDGLKLAQAPAQTGELAATLTTMWDARQLHTDFCVRGPFEPEVIGRARIAMVPSDGPWPRIERDQPMQAELNWQGEIGSVMALAALPDHSLNGASVVALRVTGTPASPRFDGELSIRDGRYEHLVAGTIVKDLTLESDFSDRGRINLTLSGNDGAIGQLHVAGVIRPNEPDALLDLRARAEKMLLVRIDAATARSSADITLKSEPGVLAIAGDVDVERAEIRLLNPLPPSIVELGEVRIVGQPTTNDREQQREASAAVTLDVNVRMPSQIFVRGRGLDSEWGGALKVSGSASSARVEGQIESRRGALDLIGRIFTLERGRIVFSGGQRVDPSLDLRLVRSANDLTGRILIDGRASRPRLRFTSNPALAEDEVLPQVLFGRSRQSLSGPEALQLAAGVAAMMRGGESVIDKTRRSLGVDVLRLESDDSNGGTNVAVGRYATEDIYVGAKQSLDGRSSAVVVEIELPKNFVVDTEVGQDANSSVGITWRRDF